MVVADTKRPVIQPAQPEESNQPEIKIDKLRSDGAEHEDVSVSIGAHAARVTPSNVAPLRNHPRLSEREAQILDGLVKGHANKVIARTCDITEATVKVHMKSILRKIRVDKSHAGGYLGDGERLCCRRNQGSSKLIVALNAV